MRQKTQKIALFSIIFLVGLSAGWILNMSIGSKFEKSAVLSTLRLGGYKWVQPLLACDIKTNWRSIKILDVKNRLETVIGSEVEKRHIASASVYFRDFSTGEDIEINSQEKYYPASLNKIPVMIAYFKAAEQDPSILSQKIRVDSALPDKNAGQEILPEDFVKAGETYTILEMIEKMIITSDNNAFFLLNSHLEENVLASTYADLGLDFLKSTSPTDVVPDFITAKDFSYFFRVLRNSTYLKPELSEKALEIMSRVTFRDGILAGTPNNAAVSHKFGLQTERMPDGEGVEKRELHDCGIVKLEKSAYLICIMTKSDQGLAEAKETIKEISRAAYEAVKASN
jgi:beta-lactamase class A